MVNSITLQAPIFTTNPSSGQQLTTTFTYTGQNLTPNGVIERFGQTPNGTVENYGNMNATSQGTLTWSYTYKCTDLTGTHRVWIRDVSKNYTTSSVTNNVSLHPTCATPTFSTNPSSGQQLITSFTYTGEGLTPNGVIERFGQTPNGTVENFGNMNANSQGTLSWSYIYKCTDQPGTHRVWIRDVSKNYATPQVANTVSANPTCSQVTLTVTPTSGQQNAVTFNYSGSNYTPNGTVRRFLTYPNGTTQEISSVTANSQGQAFATYTSTCADAVGTYYDKWRDSATGRESNTVAETITANPSCATPTFTTNPMSGQQLTTVFTYTGQNLTPNGVIERYGQLPDGTQQNFGNMNATAQGTLTWSYTYKCTDPTGTHRVWIRDVSKNYTTPPVTNTVSANTTCSTPTLPDLTISASPASSYSLGQTVQVPVTVRRTGGNLTQGTYVLARLFWSTNSTLDGGDQQLWQSNGNTDFLNSILNSSGSHTVNATITIPSNAAPGQTYYLIAVADADSYYPESNENNNIATYSVTIPNVLPDLTISASPASSYSPGQTVQVPVTVFRSGGTLPSSGIYVLARLYWSTNSTFDSGDTQLWESNGSTPDYPVSVLNSNGQRTVNATITIPGNANPGQTYYLLAYVDPPTPSYPSGYYQESNKGNNIAAYAVTTPNVLPDLTISASTASSYSPGQTVQVSVTVRRTGGNLTQGSFVLARLYWSTNSTLDGSDQQVWQSNGSTDFLNPILNSSGSHTVNATITIPSNATPGQTYYLIAVADADQYHTESNENNNTAAYSVTIPNVLPDLTINASPANNYSPGQTVQVPVTVFRSGGSLPSSGIYVLARLFWSTNSTFDSGDAQLWESNGSTPDFPVNVLNSSGQKTVNATITIPSNATPGQTYYLLAYVDPPTSSYPNGYYQETNKNNNVSSYQVSVPGLQPVTLNVTPTSGQQNAVTFNYSGSNYTPNGTVRRFLTYPNGTTQEISSVTANSQGQAFATYTSTCADAVGTYYDKWRDSATGRESNTVAETVTANPSCATPMFTTNTTSGQQLTTVFTYTGQNLTPNGVIERYGQLPDGTQQNFGNMNATAQGTLTWSYTYKCTDPTGTHRVWIRDVSKNYTTPPVANTVSANTTCSTPTLPDLTISASPASSYSPGQSVQVPVTVSRSGGNLPSDGVYVLARLYWSTNSTFDLGDIQLWESNGSTPDYPVSMLNSSGQKMVNATITIPSNAIPGQTYYLLAYVDPPTSSYPNGYYQESNKGNNTAAYAVTIPNAALPDLTISASPASNYNPGQTVQVPVTVRRTGGNLTQGTYVLARLHWSTNSTLDGGDQQLWQSNGNTDFLNSILNNNGSHTVNAAITIPSNAAPGQTYYLIAVADADQYHTESNENNNTAAYSMAILSVQLAINLDRPNASCNSVSLTWSANNVSGFVAYSVYRSTSPNVSTSASLLVDINNQSSKSYVDTSLSPGKVYYYRIFLRTIRDLIGSNEYSARSSGGAAPVINSSPITAATVGHLYNYDVQASDPDSDSLTFRLVTSPPGMMIDGLTGLITWTPGSNQLGAQHVTVEVSDGCNRRPQDFSINVQNVAASGNDVVRIGVVTLRADRITRVDSNTQILSGNVSLNNFLRFDGDLTIRSNGIVFTVSGEGTISVAGRAVIFRGGFSFTLDGSRALTNFVRTQIGPALELAGGTVEIRNLFLLDDGVRVEGKLKLRAFNVEAQLNTLQITQAKGVEVAGQIKFVNIPLPGGGRLEEISVSYDQIKSLLTGYGKLKIEQAGSTLLETELEVEVKMGCFNRLRAEIESNTRGIPIGATGLFIVGGNIEVKNICDGNFAITLGVDLTAVDPKVAEIVKLNNLQLTYQAPFTFIGDGEFELFEKRVASGKVSVSNNTGVTAEATAKLADVLDGHVDLRLDPGGSNRPGRVEGKILAKGQIPSLERVNIRPAWLRDFINAASNKVLPIPMGTVSARLVNREVTFQAQIYKVTTSVTLTFNSAIPDIDIGLNFNSTIGTFAPEEVYAQANQRLLRDFNAALAARGISIQPTLSGLILQANQPRSIELPDGLEQALFGLQGQGRVPDFTLIAPDGTRFTSASANEQIHWVVSADTFTAFYLINKPARGRWIVETSVATALFDVISSATIPHISLRTNQSTSAINLPSASESQAGTVLIQWDASAANSNVSISLYYDTDNLSANGVKIAEGLPVSPTNNSYSWDLAEVPAGEYYIYAVINDRRNAPVISYSPDKIIVEDRSTPAKPRNVAAQSIENALLVSWLPNQEANLAGYVVHYTTDLNNDNYRQSVVAGLNTTLKLTGLEPHQRYRLAVTAYNTEGKISRFSDAQTISTGDNQAPFVQLTTPNGGEQLIAGRSFTIQWLAEDDSRIESQQLLLSLDGGLSYPVLIADNLPGAARSFVWNLAPDLREAALRIRIIARDTANNAGADESDGNFSSRALPPYLAPLSPNRLQTATTELSLIIQGNRFALGATVLINNQRLVTTFTNDTQLTAIVPASLLAAPGLLQVVVENPDGQRSEAQSLAVEGGRTVASVSAASFLSNELARDSIIAAFGTNLAVSTLTATSLPLPTQMGGTTVKVRDSTNTERLAPLFFAAPTQVNYQMPPDTASGNATITITSGDGTISIGTGQIATLAPGLFSANASGQGVGAAVALRVKASGVQSYEPVSRFDQAQNKFVAIPLDLGPATDQVFLILYGTGIRFRSSISAVTAKIGNVEAQVLYAGPVDGFVSLDQINLSVPRSLIGRGEVDITLTVDGKTANTVQVSIGPITNSTPAITSISPTSVAAGSSAFTLTVTGSNFANGSVVRWNENARATSFISNTQLTATIPAGDIASPGTASITVLNPGSGVSNSLSFSITQACTYSIAPNSQSLGANGGNGTINVITGAGCIWAATSNDNWISIDSGSTGSGSGTVTYSVAINTSTTARTGTITVANQAFTITQAGAGNPSPVITSINPNSITAGGSAFTLTVNGTGFILGSVVRWNGSNRTTTFFSSTQLRADVPAADIISAGTVTIAVFNPAPGGGVSNALAFVINQACSFSIAPISQSFNASGGNGNVSVFAPSGCTWRVNNSTSWITTTSSSNGSGNGAVTFSVAANPNSVERIGTLNIAFQTFTVTQAGANPVSTITSLSPNSVMAGGAAFTLTVNGTGFINGSTVRWNGGDRTTTFVSGTQLRADVSASDIGSAGTAAITVFNPAPGGGLSNALNFTITPSSQGDEPFTGGTFFDRAGGVVGTAFLFNPVTNSGLISYIDVQGPPGWNSNNQLRISRSPLPGMAAERSMGWSFTQPVTGEYTAFAYTGSQSYVASASINATNTLPAPEITGLNVTPGQVTFNWTANSAARSFLVRINPLPFAGTITSQIIVSGSSRTATLSGLSLASGATYQALVFAFSLDIKTPGAIVGQFNVSTHSISFTASPTCSYSISPTNQSFSAGGGSSSVSVTAANGCSWTATSNNPSFINITSSGSGSGNGTVFYSVAGNNSASQRTGTLTIAGQTFTVTQAGASGITVVDHRMSSGPIPEGCAPPVTKTAYLTTDQRAYQWTHISNGVQGDAVRWDFVQPNGSVFFTTNTSLNFTGDGCFWAWINIAESNAAVLPGTWQVRVFYKEAQILTDTFTVTSAVGVNLLDHRVTAGPIPSNCVPPTQKTMYLTTDSLMYQWTYISGANAGDDVRWDFIQPSGSVYLSTPYNLTVTGGVCFWSGINIVGQQAASLPGNWQVRVYYKGALLVSDSFTITRAGAVTAAPLVTRPTLGGFGQSRGH